MASRYPYTNWLLIDANRLWTTDRHTAGEQFRKAIGRLEREKAETPGRNVALASVLLTCPDPALRDPARALELIRTRPADPDPHRELIGIALFEQGQYAAAREELEAFRPSESASTRQDAGAYNAWTCLVMSLWHIGERERATKEFQALDLAAHANPRIDPAVFLAVDRAKQLLASEPGKD